MYAYNIKLFNKNLDLKVYINKHKPLTLMNMNLNPKVKMNIHRKP